MRFFIAIPLPEEIKKNLHEVSSRISGLKGVRIVNSDNMHLTLLFLGEIKNIKKVVDELKNLTFNPFIVETDSVSLFPNNGKYRLVWININKSSELSKLQKKISKSLNFEEEREYMPHITIARIKKIDRDEKKVLENNVKYAQLNNLRFEVSNFKLYSSELTALGPVHRVIEYFQAEKK